MIQVNNRQYNYYDLGILRLFYDFSKKSTFV